MGCTRPSRRRRLCRRTPPVPPPVALEPPMPPALPPVPLITAAAHTRRRMTARGCSSRAGMLSALSRHSSDPAGRASRLSALGVAACRTPRPSAVALVPPEAPPPVPHILCAVSRRARYLECKSTRQKDHRDATPHHRALPSCE